MEEIGELEQETGPNKGQRYKLLENKIKVLAEEADL